MIKYIFIRLSAYLVFDSDADAKTQYTDFETDLINNKGRKYIDIINQLMENSLELRFFNHYKELYQIKVDIINAVYLLVELNRKTTNFIKGV